MQDALFLVVVQGVGGFWGKGVVWWGFGVVGGYKKSRSGSSRTASSTVLGIISRYKKR